MCQADIDASLVSTLKRGGPVRGGAPSSDGVTLEEARRRKERTYPQLYGVRGKARLFVFAGKWSAETHWLCRRSLLHTSSSFQAQAAWLCKWSSILWCASAASFSQLLPFLGALRPMGQFLPFTNRDVFCSGPLLPILRTCGMSVFLVVRVWKTSLDLPHNSFSKGHLLLRFNLHFFLCRALLCATKPSLSNLSRERCHSLTSNLTKCTPSRCLHAPLAQPFPHTFPCVPYIFARSTA